MKKFKTRILKSKSKKAVTEFFSSLGSYGVSKANFLKVIHKDFSQEKNKQYFNQIFEFAQNIKVDNFEYLNFKIAGEYKGSFALDVEISLKYEINTKFAKRYNVVPKSKFAFSNHILKTIRVHPNIDGKMVINPYFLNEIYRELLVTVIDETKTIDLQTEIISNKLKEIPENNIIYVFEKGKNIGTLRKFENKWTIKKFGENELIGSYINRLELILNNKQFEFKITDSYGKFIKISL